MLEPYFSRFLQSLQMFGSTLVGPCLPVYMLCAFVRTFLDGYCLLLVQTRSLPVHVSERSYITSSVSLCDEKVLLNSEDASWSLFSDAKSESLTLPIFTFLKRIIQEV
ncbi:hypothetical protein T07_3157 [Trichinella nelsoni]|uniref:Uncharacterized protein n=1 Tax=Trichinella nelsoni TaxID=6336 RepID=A0A0V0SKC5_9BILA|nr:hypothetical protein T07_3157 [Trichinella nelsoni]